MSLDASWWLNSYLLEDSFHPEQFLASRLTFRTLSNYWNEQWKIIFKNAIQLFPQITGYLNQPYVVFKFLIASTGVHDHRTREFSLFEAYESLLRPRWFISWFLSNFLAERNSLDGGTSWKTCQRIQQEQRLHNNGSWWFSFFIRNFIFIWLKTFYLHFVIIIQTCLQMYKYHSYLCMYKHVFTLWYIMHHPWVLLPHTTRNQTSVCSMNPDSNIKSPNVLSVFYSSTRVIIKLIYFPT